MEVGVTVFTPTYNRGYTLERLYHSLCRQTNEQFEWLIIDDGSTDNTAEIVNKWKLENKIKIRYFYQINSGKAQAHNLAIKKAEKALFTCVDSDDYLVDNALEVILEKWRGSNEIIGMLFARGYSDGSRITKLKRTGIVSSLRRAYRNSELSGDTMLIYDTKILSQFMFPQIEGEKFIPEAYLYDLMDQIGNIQMFDNILYIGEYLEDGYTYSIRRVIAENPNGYEIFIKQRLVLESTFQERIFDIIRYVAIKYTKKDSKIINDSPFPLLTLLLYPFGLVFYYRYYHKYSRRND
ncbi:TPA: glycosyltransferase family 2 protein [Streptococcus suis]